MKSAYGRSYSPSAPSIEIWIGVPTESLSLGPLRALVDTGADACIIPVGRLAPLGLTASSRRYVRGYIGDRTEADVFLVDVGVGAAR